MMSQGVIGIGNDCRRENLDFAGEFPLIEMSTPTNSTSLGRNCAFLSLNVR